RRGRTQRLGPRGLALVHPARGADQREVVRNPEVRERLEAEHGTRRPLQQGRATGVKQELVDGPDPDLALAREAAPEPDPRPEADRSPRDLDHATKVDGPLAGA